MNYNDKIEETIKTIKMIEEQINDFEKKKVFSEESKKQNDSRISKLMDIKIYLYEKLNRLMEK